jgi:hypothetical protein
MWIDFVLAFCVNSRSEKKIAIDEPWSIAQHLIEADMLLAHSADFDKTCSRART